MNSYTLDQYRLARCPQVVGDKDNKGNPALMQILINTTKEGSVCNGCSWFRTGCIANMFLKSGQAFSTINPITTESVRNEAARLGLSIGEIRRRRNGG
jgi:hypothetical protein